MPLFGFGKKTPTSVRRPSASRKPTPKTSPQSKPKGLFGAKKYRTFTNLREFARKAPFERAPKYGKRLGKKERVGLMDTLKKYSGSSYGISEQKFNTAMRKMKKDKMYTKDYKKKKELDQKIRMLEKWKKEA